MAGEFIQNLQEAIRALPDEDRNRVLFGDFAPPEGEGGLPIPREHAAGLGQLFNNDRPAQHRIYHYRQAGIPPDMLEGGINANQQEALDDMRRVWENARQDFNARIQDAFLRGDRRGVNRGELEPRIYPDDLPDELDE